MSEKSVWVVCGTTKNKNRVTVYGAYRDKAKARAKFDFLRNNLVVMQRLRIK